MGLETCSHLTSVVSGILSRAGDCCKKSQNFASFCTYNTPNISGELFYLSKHALPPRPVSYQIFHKNYVLALLPSGSVSYRLQPPPATRKHASQVYALWLSCVSTARFP